jgi:hypothetical protein
MAGSLALRAGPDPSLSHHRGCTELDTYPHTMTKKINHDIILCVTLPKRYVEYYEEGKGVASVIVTVCFVFL